LDSDSKHGRSENKRGQFNLSRDIDLNLIIPSFTARSDAALLFVGVSVQTKYRVVFMIFAQSTKHTAEDSGQPDSASDKCSRYRQEFV
jgi:hypothetical protein